MADTFDMMKEVVRAVIKEELTVEIEHDTDSVPGGEQEITTKVTLLLGGKEIRSDTTSTIIGYEEY